MRFFLPLSLAVSVSISRSGRPSGSSRALVAMFAVTRLSILNSLECACATERTTMAGAGPGKPKSVVQG